MIRASSIIFLFKRRYTQTHTHKYSHSYTYTYKHTHTHTHTRSYTRSCLFRTDLLDVDLITAWFWCAIG